MYGANQIVNVNAFYFLNGPSLKAFPKEVEVDNTTYTFSDGIQMLVRKGQHIVKLFDMNDGRQQVRLRQEGDTWTLVGTRTM